MVILYIKNTIFFLFILLSIPLYAQNPRTILPLSSPVYTMVDNIYYEAGKAQPDTARPWSYGELEAVLSRINYSNLSKAGKEAYTYIRNTLSWDNALVSDGVFSFDSSLILNPEGFYHIELADSLNEEAQSYQWQHGYEERRSILKIPLEFWYGEKLYMTSVLEAKEEYRTVTSPDTPDVAQNYSNLLFDDVNPRIDLYFPFRAVLSTGGLWWDIFFGRDDLSWGNGQSGNLLLSDYSDFHDLLMVKFRSDTFTFTNVYTVMDRFLPDGTNIIYSAFLGHRLDASFFNGRVGLTVTESVVFANAAGSETLNFVPELIRDLNFLMVFHNWTIPERTNSLMTVEVTVNPWKYFNIYGQLAMDEFTTGYEADRGGGGGPPIFGYLAGLKGVYPLGSGYLSAVGEWVLTNPWLYNRRAAPYYYNTRRYWSLVTDRMEYIAKPLGYEYGPDSIVYFFKTSYQVPGLFCAGFDMTRLVQGECDIGTEWDPVPDTRTPTGIPEKSWILHLEGQYSIRPWITLGADFYWQTVENTSHVQGAARRDIEIAAHVTLKL